jgi:predicted  nucleic acid-binding Zn-ribbon protein
MNIDEQMLTLGKLSRADLRLKELTAVLKEGPRELGEHRKAMEAAQSSLEETEQQREEAVEGRAEAEKELVTTERRLTQSQANAKRIATEAQHEASQIEVTALQRRRDEWEDQVLVRMTRAEELEGKIPGMKKAVKKTEKAYGKVEKSVPELVGSAKREAVALLRARDQILGTLDAPVRRLYETAASRPGNPLTTVLDKICQTCHTRVPPQHLVETLQSRAVHICPNCKKIVGKVMHSPDE